MTSNHVFAASALLAAACSSVTFAAPIAVQTAGSGYWEDSSAYAPNAGQEDWFAAGRNLHSGPNTWESGVGSSLSRGNFAQDHFSWTSGNAVGFSLRYDSVARAMEFMLRDVDGQTSTSSYTLASDATGFDTIMIQLNAQTRNRNSTVKAQIEGVSFRDAEGSRSIDDDLTASSSDADLSWAAISDGTELGDRSWQLAGEVTFQWTGQAPRGDLAAFELRGLDMHAVPTPAAATPLLLAFAWKERSRRRSC